MPSKFIITLWSFLVCVRNVIKNCDVANLTYDVQYASVRSYQLSAISYSNLLYDLKIFTNHPPIVQRQNLVNSL